MRDSRSVARRHKITDTNQQTRPEEQPAGAPHLERPQEIQKILLLVIL